MNYWITLLRPGDVQLRAAFINRLPKRERTVLSYHDSHAGDDKIIGELIGAEDIVPMRRPNGTELPGYWESKTVQRIHTEVDTLWRQYVVDSGRSLRDGKSRIPPGRCSREIEIAFGFRAVIQHTVCNDGGGWEVNDGQRRLQREAVIAVMMNPILLDFVVTQYLAFGHLSRRLLAA